VVGKFIEFFGEGVRTLSLPDRATIGNMGPVLFCVFLCLLFLGIWSDYGILPG